MLVRVTGAGKEDCNGIYHVSGKVSFGKPVFLLEATTAVVAQVLSFRPAGGSAPGWGLREVWVNDGLDEAPEVITSYCAESTADEPPTEGWVSLPAGLEPVPTVELFVSGKKRARQPVMGVQERVWKQRKFTDAEVVCGGVHMAVHRATLCAASPVLDAAFSSSMAEGKNSLYEIKDSTPEAVEAMLCYIYTGGSAFPVTQLPQLLELAVKYQLADLIADVVRELPKGITPESVRERLAILKRHSAIPIVKDALIELLKSIKAADSNELILALI
mmetsp:Transcript_27857/g.86745  ORF Transcript_27857/g.86745 Transcript_27857/m.86745 type:complete len:274 (+) Transcript_27857:49-870(+)